MQDTEQSANDKAGDEAMASEVPGDADAGTHRRDWSKEEKAWIAQESYDEGATVVQVAERHGVPVRRLSRWRKQLRRGELVVPPRPEVENPFAAIAVEATAPAVHVGAVSVEARGVTVRLDGDVSTARISAIASALRGIR